MSIPFCKFHGFGNDYIVINETDAKGRSLPDLAIAMCERHKGIGGDGIAVLIKPEHTFADFFCEIINPDGSVAGFSGNGTRIAAASLYYKGLWTEPHLRLQTRSGLKNFHLLERKGEGKFTFEAEIGYPRFESEEIPVATFQPKSSVIDERIHVAGTDYKFSAVNVGNPVAVVFVDNFDFDWRTIGRSMESNEMFPKKANIVWARVIDSENIEIRIWERGAGETSASGTCASGAAVLTAFTGRTGRKVNVHSPGGTAILDWRDDDEMVLTGKAELAFCGEWPA